MNYLLIDILDKLIDFQKQNSNIIIGGSVSLMLQNQIPFRIPKDIDIISKDKIHIFDIFNINKERKPLCKVCNHNGLRFELFINAQAKYIEYNHKEQILKISPQEEIWEWKMRSKYSQNSKHQSDIQWKNK